MIKRHITSILITILPLTTIAQEPSTDSIATQELQEVVIQAPKVVHKADMDVLYPSQSAVERSHNGMQLLRNLSIPALTVNEVMGTISVASKDVQVRINGRVASIDQVKNLLPETIKRVEWIDNPGLRYNGANAVLNFIVENPTVGGSLMTQAMPALNCAWGDYYASLKLNNGRSQWGADVMYKLTNKVGTYREYNERFTYMDATTLTRTETPTDGHTSYNIGNIGLNYSYIKPDTTVFYVTIKGNNILRNEEMYQGILQLSDGSSDINLFDKSGNQGFTPSMQAYFEQHFAHNQLLAVDFTASLYNGNTYRTYQEREIGAQSYLSDVNTYIKDCNQAYGITTDYIKNWKNKRLTAGVTYTANRNRSTYENLDGAIYHQRQDKVYFFAEYFQRIRKVSLTAGFGAQYTSFLFKESDRGTDSWNMRPRLTINYRPTQVARLTLSFTSWQSTPTLAQINVAAQQNDGFQWTVGNQDLKASNAYQLSLEYQHTLSRVSWELGTNLSTIPNAIAPFYKWQEDKLIKSYENSRGYQQVSAYLAPTIVVIPNWLNITGLILYRAERSRGTDYTHYNHNWAFDATAEISHWGFTLYAQYMKAPKQLFGESITWGETISILMLSYNRQNFEFGVGMLNPFNKYDRGSKSLTKYNVNEMHNRLDMNCMPFIRIAYNVQWGHQKREASKLVNTDASVDKSTAGSR